MKINSNPHCPNKNCVEGVITIDGQTGRLCKKCNPSLKTGVSSNEESSSTTMGIIAKKVIRYYSECGKGFWKKQKAVIHNENCKCWKNPKFKTCLSCIHKSFIKDSNGMEKEPQFLQTWVVNNCKHSEYGVPVHRDFEHVRKYCQFHETK